jgi:hypothetical protein
MIFKMKATIFLWLVLCITQSMSAQRGIVSSGGDISSPNGSVAYSVGQIAYVSISSDSRNLTTGLQHSFEIGIVGISNSNPDSMWLLYPNPSSQDVYLHFSSENESSPASDFSARIFDMNGKLLITHRLHNDVNTISIREFSSGMYVIQIWDATRIIQSKSFSKTN